MQKECSYSTTGYRCRQTSLSYSRFGFCIFHESKKSKEDCKRFQELVEAKIAKGDYLFKGYVFPGDQVNFSGLTFHGDADFSESTFQGNEGLILVEPPSKAKWEFMI